MASPIAEVTSPVIRKREYVSVFVAVIASFLTGPSIVACQPPAEPLDVVVYGGTPAGIAAAIQSARMGKSVVLLEPSHHLGGLTTGGLGQTDIGNKSAIGGISREFYVRVRRHYESPDAWKWQTHDEYRSMGQSRTSPDESTMWTFEPHVALKIYRDWLKECGISVEMGRRLDRKTGVIATRASPWQILSIRMESGEVYRGRMFIDATYEGDLMAAAGVACTMGR